jgi:lipoprotein-anchoring transpeptidase ErfK/SrfK
MSLFLRAAALVAALLFSGFAVAMTVPEGFRAHTIQKGDTLGKLVSAEYHDITLKANRMDEHNFDRLKPGKQVLVPVSSVALGYVPIETQIATSKTRVIIIDKASQAFGAYENGALVLWGPVSTAKRGKSTPNGTFRIGSRERMHYSSRYNNAPMPYAQQVNGHIFMHQFSLPGFPASHGCIRLLMADAQWLFGWTKIGDMVIVR